MPGDLNFNQGAYDGYREAMLWAEEDQLLEGMKAGGIEDPSLNVNESFSPSAIAKMQADLTKFYAENGEAIEQFKEEEGEDDTQIGHSFWLTRQGHVAGFGDFSGEGAKALDAAVDYDSPLGHLDWYVGDDGLIYFMGFEAEASSDGKSLEDVTKDADAIKVELDAAKEELKKEDTESNLAKVAALEEKLKRATGVIRNMKADAAKLSSYRITFEDGNVIETNMAEYITLEDAKKYYIGTSFTFGSGEEGDPEHQSKAVSVEDLGPFDTKAASGAPKMRESTPEAGKLDEIKRMVEDVHPSGVYDSGRREAFDKAREKTLDGLLDMSSLILRHGHYGTYGSQASRRVRAEGVWSEEQAKAVADLDAEFNSFLTAEGIEPHSKEASDGWKSGFQNRFRKIFGKDVEASRRVKAKTAEELKAKMNPSIYEHWMDRKEDKAALRGALDLLTSELDKGLVHDSADHSYLAEKELLQSLLGPANGGSGLGAPADGKCRLDGGELQHRGRNPQAKRKVKASEGILLGNYFEDPEETSFSPEAEFVGRTIEYGSPGYPMRFNVKEVNDLGTGYYEFVGSIDGYDSSLDGDDGDEDSNSHFFEISEQNLAELYVNHLAEWTEKDGALVEVSASKKVKASLTPEEVDGVINDIASVTIVDSEGSSEDFVGEYSSLEDANIAIVGALEAYGLNEGYNKVFLEIKLNSGDVFTKFRFDYSENNADLEESFRKYLASNVSVEASSYVEGEADELIANCGFSIGTSHEDVIKQNAEEDGIELDWDKVNEDIQAIETQCIAWLDKQFGSARAEGHDSDGDLIGTLFVYKNLDEIKDVIEGGEGLMTSSGTLDILFDGLTYEGNIGVTVNFFDVEMEDGSTEDPAPSVEAASKVIPHDGPVPENSCPMSKSHLEVFKEGKLFGLRDMDTKEVVLEPIYAHIDDTYDKATTVFSVQTPEGNKESFNIEIDPLYEDEEEEVLSDKEKEDNDLIVDALDEL